MQIQASGTVFEGHNPKKDVFSSFPILCRLQNGRIIAAFQNGIAKHVADCTVMLTYSEDSGRTWSRPDEPFREWAVSKGYAAHLAYISEISPGRLLASLLLCDHLGNPALPMFNPETGGALPIFIGLAESLDGGQTWREPVVLKVKRFNDVPVPITSPIVKTPDGALILPFETSKKYYDSGIWEHYAASLLSQDGGKTWDDVRIIAHDPENRIMYWDHRMVSIEGGRCLDFFYTFDNAAGKEISIHRSVSMDGGRTWPEKPFDTGLPGQPWPVPLRGDEIVVLRVDRYGDGAIKANLSPDLGATWSDELMFYRHRAKVRKNDDTLTDNLNEQMMWCYGLVSGVTVGEREILAIWYCGAPDATRIECARIRV